MRTAFTAEERRMADYLLGRLPEDERRAITDQVLTDDGVYRSLLAVEEALIDAYAWGDLDETEARLLESTLLVNEAARVKLITARALCERTRRDRSRRSQQKWLVAAAAVLLACAVGLGMLRTRGGTAGTAPSAIVMLAPEVSRGSAAVADVTIPKSAATISFSVPIAPEDRAPGYEAKVRGPKSAETTVPAYEAERTVRFDLERARLAAGRYEFEVYGVDGPVRRLIAFMPANLK